MFPVLTPGEVEKTGWKLVFPTSKVSLTLSSQMGVRIETHHLLQKTPVSSRAAGSPATNTNHTPTGAYVALFSHRLYFKKVSKEVEGAVW